MCEIFEIFKTFENFEISEIFEIFEMPDLKKIKMDFISHKFSHIIQKKQKKKSQNKRTSAKTLHLSICIYISTQYTMCIKIKK